VAGVPGRVSQIPLAEKPKGRGRLRKWLLALLVMMLVLVAGAGVTALLVVRHFEQGLPSVSDLRGNYHPPQVTRVLARDGTLLAELFTERRTVVPIASLPPQVKLAVLAAEDAGFYEHEGLNYYGILRAFLVNLRAGRTRQGGSTITQQVVKNLLLDPERTYKRKIREALLARRLEQELSKDEILELYLNHIYFGHGRYGIEEAARDNFGKSAKDLSIAEAALLAGLVAGPEAYSPRKDVTKALQRRAYVLFQMHEKGFLDDAQYAAAKDEPVHLAPEVELNTALAPEAVEIAKKTLRDLEGNRAARGGYTITTTIDPRLQAAARKALRDDLDAYDKRHAALGPLKAPPTIDARARVTRGATKGLVPFEGTPDFQMHKVLVGEVTEADDARGTFDVQVGTVTGTVKLADYERYNPKQLAPSAFAEVGARVRVSLLAPVPVGIATFHTSGGKANAVAKVPLRLELGPEGALVAIDVRSREILALVGSYEATTGGHRRAPRGVRRGLQARELRGVDRERPAPAARGARGLGERRGGARARGCRAGERRRVGARARHSLDDEAGPVARARQLRGAADRAVRRVRHVRGRRDVRGAEAHFTHRGARRQGRRARATGPITPRARAGRGIRDDELAHERRGPRNRRRSEAPRATARGEDGDEQPVEGRLVRGLLDRPRGRGVGRLRRREAPRGERGGRDGSAPCVGELHEGGGREAPRERVPAAAGGDGRGHRYAHGGAASAGRPRHDDRGVPRWDTADFARSAGRGASCWRGDRAGARGRGGRAGEVTLERAGST
jgi:hypothetical protein